MPRAHWKVRRCLAGKLPGTAVMPYEPVSREICSSRHPAVALDPWPAARRRTRGTSAAHSSAPGSSVTADDSAPGTHRTTGPPTVPEPSQPSDAALGAALGGQVDETASSNGDSGDSTVVGGASASSGDSVSSALVLS